MNWKEANEELNTMLEKGAGREAFEEFYAEDVIMQENEDEPRVSKLVTRELCLSDEVTRKHADLKMTIMSVAYGENLSIQEVMFDYTGANGKKIHYPEVAVRYWKDNLVVREKFYYIPTD